MFLNQEIFLTQAAFEGNISPFHENVHKVSRYIMSNNFPQNNIKSK